MSEVTSKSHMSQKAFLPRRIPSSLERVTPDASRASGGGVGRRTDVRVAKGAIGKGEARRLAGRVPRGPEAQDKSLRPDLPWGPRGLTVSLAASAARGRWTPGSGLLAQGDGHAQKLRSTVLALRACGGGSSF